MPGLCDVYSQQFVVPGLTRDPSIVDRRSSAGLVQWIPGQARDDAFFEAALYDTCEDGPVLAGP
jgi:hypothetical protein